MNTKRINSTMPAATTTQRLSAMSTAQLMFAAKELAVKSGLAYDAACTAVLAELESRVSGPSFEAFVSEIYA